MQGRLLLNACVLVAGCILIGAAPGWGLPDDPPGRPEEEKLRRALTAVEKEFDFVGWGPEANTWRIVYRFWADGTLVVQSKGEKAVSKGTWQLEGDRLTMSYGTPRKSVTMKLEVKDHHHIVLDGEAFRALISGY